MIATTSRALRTTAAAVVAATLIAGLSPARAAVILFEDFQDEVLVPNAAIANATIAGGVSSYNDAAANRATFSVVQNLSANDVLTYSFDIVAPIVRGEPASFELILRAGVGTAQTTLANADQVVESIVFRDGNRGAYVNNGNESIFMIVNNSAVNDLVFNSPVDGAETTLLPLQYIPYVKDNATGTWGTIKGISSFNGGQRPLERFAIGSSSTAHVGAFSLDNVAVRTGVTFVPVPEPAAAALALCGLVALSGLRRRL